MKTPSEDRVVMFCGITPMRRPPLKTPSEDRIRRGDWIQTFSGVEFYPLDPRPDEIRIEDIAHALSMLCRFTGHVRRFYSVAEHSIRVCHLCPPRAKLCALLHDASEAYLTDLPRPVKRYSDIGTLYRQAEDRLMEQICAKFSLENPTEPCVELADKAMLWIEAQTLMPPHPAWLKWKSFTNGQEPPIKNTMSPAQAESEFLALYQEWRHY